MEIIKSIALTLVSNEAVMGLIVTGVAVLVAQGVNYLISKIKSERWRKFMLRAVPPALDTFLIVNKELAKSKRLAKYKDKIDRFNELFPIKFKEYWGKDPNKAEFGIAKSQVVDAVLNEKKN